MDINAETIDFILKVITLATIFIIATGLIIGGSINYRKSASGIYSEDQSFNIVDVFLCLGFLWFFSKQAFIEPQAAAEGTSATMNSVVINAIASIVFIGIVVGRYAVKRNLKFIKFTPLSWRNDLLYPLGVIATLYIVNFFYGVAIHEWLKSVIGTDTRQTVVIEMQNQPDLAVKWGLSILAVIFAPFMEEIVFRGYIYPATAFFTNKWFAGITSALLFGVIHHNAFALIPLTIFGVLLVLLYERTKSVLPCIIAHLIFNLISVLSLHFLSK